MNNLDARKRALKQALKQAKRAMPKRRGAAAPQTNTQDEPSFSGGNYPKGTLA